MSRKNMLAVICAGFMGLVAIWAVDKAYPNRPTLLTPAEASTE